MKQDNLKFWEQEYQAKDVPSSRTFFPSGVLKDYCDNKDLSNLVCAIDLGAGNLRNSIFLAEQGLDVTSIEWVKEATNAGLIEAEKRNINRKIHVLNNTLDEPIPAENDSVDLIIDMMVFHLLNVSQRSFISSEITRVLKPGGKYLLFTIGAEGSEYDNLITKSPGDEPGSYTFEHNGFLITEKGFTYDEIVNAFPQMQVLSFEKKISVSNAFGGQYERVYYFFILEKA